MLSSGSGMEISGLSSRLQSSVIWQVCSVGGIRTQKLATSGPLNRAHYNSITSTPFSVESNEVINFLTGKDRVKM